MFLQCVFFILGWVDQMSAGGGLDAALNLSFRPEATKICVLIGKKVKEGILY